MNHFVLLESFIHCLSSQNSEYVGIKVDCCAFIQMKQTGKSERLAVYSYGEIFRRWNHFFGSRGLFRILSLVVTRAGGEGTSCDRCYQFSYSFIELIRG